jgi:hypothetical protein
MGKAGLGLLPEVSELDAGSQLFERSPPRCLSRFLVQGRGSWCSGSLRWGCPSCSPTASFPPSPSAPSYRFPVQAAAASMRLCRPWCGCCKDPVHDWIAGIVANSSIYWIALHGARA